MTTPVKLTLYACLLHSAFCLSVAAQTTAFAYQGSLSDNGSPVSGLYDLQFAIYDVETNGVAIDTVTNAATEVVNGLLTVTLDLGPSVFDGGDRWLEIGATTNGGGVFSTLSPRQRITSTPYAIRAANSASAEMVSGTVAASQLTGMISSNNIGDGSITSVMLANGAVGADQLADGAVTADKIASVTEMVLMKSLFNPTPASGDKFGYSVAALGTDKMIIGASEDDLGATNSGVVYLYSTAGALLNTITNPTPAAGDFFGHKVAGLGADKVLVGAFSDDTTGTNSGSAYLFNTDGTLLTTFANPTPTNNDYFGIAVAAVGAGMLLIGAHGDDAGGVDVGAAYLFSTNGTLLTTFTNPTPVAGEQFGLTLAAVGGDKVLFGVRGDDAGATDSGVAYLFGTNGTLLNTFTNPTPASSDYFGFAVAGVGTDKVLIGAVFDDAGATNSGVAYLFSTTGTLLTTWTKATAQSGDLFGYTVAGAGAEKVLIGALQDDAGATDAGAVYLFSTNGTLLNTFTNPTPASGDYFGWVMAAVGLDQVLIGAPQENTGATDSGAAYLYGPTSYTPGLVAEGMAPNAVGSLEITDGSISEEDVDPTSFNTTFWKTGGNAGTTPGGNFLGTTDNQALEFKVNNVYALRIEPTASTPNFIGGYSGNSVGSGTYGTVVAGGSNNVVGATAPYSSIGGGFNNTISLGAGHTTISGGSHNNVAGNSFGSTIGGGDGNYIGTTAVQSTIGGGIDNSIGTESFSSTIAGGRLNDIGVNDIYSVIGGGQENSIAQDSWHGVISGGWANEIGVNADHSTIGGGRDNLAEGQRAVVSGGHDNRAAGTESTIGGGLSNRTIGGGATVSGGRGNLAAGGSAVVGGGNNNEADGDISTVGGGQANVAAVFQATIAGGQANIASGTGSSIGGGTSNTAGGPSSTVGGGQSNNASGSHAAVGGGQANRATGHYSTVVGGRDNIASGGYAFAAGNRAEAVHTGTFVWADFASTNFTSTAANQFLIRATGGVGIGTANPASALHVVGTVTATAFNPPSDRNLKENFEPVSAQEMLDRVAALPITRWNFKGDAIRHVGPMAQDFHAAFGLGTDERHIATVDADGVALAAIQGLNQKLEIRSQSAEVRSRELEARLEQKDAEIAKLEQRLAALEQIIGKQKQH